MTSKAVSSPVYQLGWVLKNNHQQDVLPLFIGYTEKVAAHAQVVQINSLAEFEQRFGSASQPVFHIEPDVHLDYRLSQRAGSQYQLYASVQLFFAGQNGPCQIFSLGQYQDKANLKDFTLALSFLKTVPFSILLAPDASMLSGEAHELFEQSLKKLQQQAKHADLVRETVPLYPWPFQEKRASSSLPLKLSQGLSPSLHYIENTSTLVELLLWEAGQYLKEEIITERRYAKLRQQIMQLKDKSVDSADVQAALLPRSPLLQDILDDMAIALKPFPELR